MYTINGNNQGFPTNPWLIWHIYSFVMAITLLVYGSYLKSVNKPEANKLLTKGSISVARSLIPGKLCVVDETMEETLMYYVKTKGIIGGASLWVFLKITCIPMLH